ncbi:MAG TPA: helix-turn-helix transcriptional regulator [Solirubrobacterales bacterium]|nr:helix-turn-helix transcriptional regulator [Solirubrobacterales bacterium]
MSLVAQRFAQNLSRCKAQSGLSTEALATRSGIHRTQVSALVNGKQVPRLDTLVKLAGALGVSPARLVEGIRWEPATSPGEFKLGDPGR